MRATPRAIEGSEVWFILARLSQPSATGASEMPPRRGPPRGSRGNEVVLLEPRGNLSWTSCLSAVSASRWSCLRCLEAVPGGQAPPEQPLPGP